MGENEEKTIKDFSSNHKPKMVKRTQRAALEKQKTRYMICLLLRPSKMSVQHPKNLLTRRYYYYYWETRTFSQTSCLREDPYFRTKRGTKLAKSTTKTDYTLPRRYKTFAIRHLSKFKPTLRSSPKHKFPPEKPSLTSSGLCGTLTRFGEYDSHSWAL